MAPRSTADIEALRCWRWGAIGGRNGVAPSRLALRSGQSVERAAEPTCDTSSSLELLKRLWLSHSCRKPLTWWAESRGSRDAIHHRFQDEKHRRRFGCRRQDG